MRCTGTNVNLGGKFSVSNYNFYSSIGKEPLDTCETFMVIIHNEEPVFKRKVKYNIYVVRY